MTATTAPARSAAPVIKGRTHVREMRALGLDVRTKAGSSQPSDYVEAGGFFFAPETVGALQQIDLLRRWRALRKSGDESAADKMLPSLMLSINAIASGLRTTG